MIFSSIIKHRSVQIAFIAGVYLALAPYLSVRVNEGLYSVSIFIKDLLMWMLPITVSAFIASTVVKFRHHAVLFIAALIFFETASNMTGVWYAYLWGQATIGHIPQIDMLPGGVSLEPLWRIPFAPPSFWSAQNGVLAGILVGCLTGLFNYPKIERAKVGLRNAVEWILVNVFAPAIPLFVLGFLAQIYTTHLFSQAAQQYTSLIGGLVLCLIVYLILLFLLSAKGSIKRALLYAHNLAPAGVMALTSGCSLSTMPWTIAGAAKNLKKPELARAIIPTTTNVQQAGDCILQSFLCFVVYAHFYGATVDVLTWAKFSVVFVLARFAVAAILGGAFFVMVPIYEAYLGFTPEMIAIMLAFNVVLDPIVTSCNVMANGALCKIFESAWMRLRPAQMTQLPPVSNVLVK